MVSRRKSWLWLTIACFLGVIVGASIALTFSTWFLNYGDTTRLIADATYDVAALEHLASGDTTGVESILKARLEASMVGLDAHGHRLTASQQNQVAKIEARARKFIKQNN